MTASKVSSANVTNVRARPVTRLNSGTSGLGQLVTITGTMEVATTSIDEIGDVIMIADVKGGDRVVAIRLACDDLDTHATATLAFDVGLYKDVDAAGTSATVVDADAYASAVLHDSFIKTIATGAFSHNCAFEARDIAKQGVNTVALDGAALSGEESVHNHVRTIGLTVTAVAATAAAGTLSWEIVVIRP